MYYTKETTYLRKDITMIRPFKPKDLNEVMNIWLHTNTQAHNFISKDYWINHFEMVQEILPTAEVYVYEEGEIKGFIGITDGYIAGLFVLANEQSKGLGKQLLDFLKTKYDKLILTVYEKNIRATRFYQKQDFVITHTSIEAATNEVELHMIWEI